MRRYLTILILAALPFRAQAQGNITTIAGSTWVFPADGRPAAIAPLGRITALTTDQLNNLYVVDPENAMVFKVAPTGVLTIVAGNGISGFSGDFGPAVDASLNCPAAVAVDNKGNVFIADPCSFRVRKVTPEGIITTVAGTGEYEVSLDGGSATDAPLLPLSVAVDSAGNLYIGESEYADEFRTETHRIRMVTPAGMISTVAGAGPGGFAGDNGPARAALLYQPRHLAIDGQGNIFFVEGGDAVRVRRFKPGGNISTVAGEGGPADSSAINAGGIALDAAGILYIADSRGNRVKRVQSDGTIVTVAGTGAYGHLGDGGPASQATFGNPDGIAVATSGDIYISDTQNKRIRRVNQATTIETIAGNRFYKFGGDGGAATAAFLNQPGDVVTDKTGNIFIADTYNHRIRKISNGVITTYAGTGEVGFSGDGGKATQAELCYPAGLAVDSKNNLYIADSANSRVRMVRPDGVIVSVAGGEYTCGGTPSPELPIQLGGRIYSVAIDSKDDLYVADGFQIHRIDANGATVLAGTGGFSGVPAPDGTPAKEAILEYPGGLAVDAAGIVYFGQIFTLSRIRTINANGVLGTLAGLGPPGVLGDGGPALQSDLGPASLRFDASGNLLIADRSDRRIRRISGGIINTVAGGGSGGANSGDGGPAVSASLAAPLGVAPGAGGAILIADAGSDRIRLVSPLPPTFDVSTERIDFNISSGGITPTDQTIKLTSPIAGLAYSAQVLEGNGNWLSVRPASGVMPATLLVTASPPTEAVGLLEARIAISIPAANQVRNVNVTLRITPADEPRLSTGTDFLGVPALEGGRQIVRQFQILNNGSGSLDFGVQSTTTTGGGWLEVTASGSTVSASSPQTATVRITPGTLTPGTYSGLITVSSPQAPQPLFVPVKLTVTSAAPAILLSQDGMNFESVEGAINLAPQTFGVVNRGAGGMAWTARAITLSGGNWLSLNQNSGTSGPAGLGVPSVQVKVDPSKLSLGDYYGQVEIVAPGAANSPQTLSVVLTVIARGGTLRPDIRPTGLIFVSVPAENGPLQTPPSQAITLTNYGETPITFRSSQSTNDFQFRPQSGTITGDQPVRIVVTPQPGLPVGIRRGTITLEFSDGTVRLVDILVIVPPSGALRSASLSGLPRADGCVPTSLGLVFSLLGQEFTTVKSLPTPVQIRVADSCGTFLETGTVVASFSNGDRLLALIPTGNGYWDGTWIPAAASAGAARVRIRVDAESLDRKLSSFIEITGGVNPGAATPLITPGGVVNSASPAVPSALAPGTLISIFGQRLAAASAVPEPGTIATQLEGTLVVLKGIALQLLYVSSDQINAMVPLDLPPNTSYQLFVQQGSKVAVPAEVLLAAVQPAIFSIAGTGSGQGAIISTGGALVDNVNPAQAGDTISIFAAGLGAVTPAVPSGSVSPSSPPARTQALVQVSIGGKPAVMTFAGLAPGFFGLYQINVVVPDGIPPGPSIPVTLTAGSETSPAVTIAVR